MNNIYFNPKIYLPYQRNFIFINSERTIGKTYSTQKFQIERYLSKGEKFVYFVRTQKEKGAGVFADAYMKVLNEQFPDHHFKFRNNKCYLDEYGDGTKLEHAGTCIAISEANSTKRINYPLSKWGLFDEYIIDVKKRSEYVDGWNEPNLFLKCYHTIDRENDYLTVFMLANSIEFFNPYHVHQAFNIQPTPIGKRFVSDNVIYEHVEASEELKKKKKKSKFLKMIEGTEYGDYAVNGVFINDNENFISDKSKSAKLKFNLDCVDITVGIWYDNTLGYVFISDKFDPNFSIWYTYDSSVMSPNKKLVKGKEAFLCRWLGNMFKRGLVFWKTMELKGKTMSIISKMI